MWNDCQGVTSATNCSNGLNSEYGTISFFLDVLMLGREIRPDPTWPMPCSDPKPIVVRQNRIEI